MSKSTCDRSGPFIDFLIPFIDFLIKCSKLESDRQLLRYVLIKFIWLKDISTVAVPTGRAIIVLISFDISGKAPLCDLEFSISCKIAWIASDVHLLALVDTAVCVTGSLMLEYSYPVTYGMARLVSQAARRGH